MFIRNYLSFVVCILVVIREIRGEFRFCHFGPQKVSNGECPYGVMLNKPLTSSCVYYANDQSGPFAEPELAQCNAAPKNLQTSGEKLENQQFQALFMEVTDPTDKGERGKLGNDCEECLSKWVPPDDRPSNGGGATPPVEEPEYDDMVHPLEPYDAEFHKNLTVQQFLTLFEFHRPTMAYMRSAKLLNRSLEIMREICSPYIPEEFMDQIYRGFMFLVLKSREKVADVGAFEKREIDIILDKCRGKMVSDRVNLTGIVCNNYTRITGYSLKDNGTGEAMNKDYYIEAKSFRWGKYDPIIESAWMAIDFVHGYCFDEFRPDLNMHHIYQAGLEPLFTRTIMQRWPFPPKLKRGDGYWNNLLEVKDAKVMMQNMDACVQFGYALAPFEKRLNRPFNKFYTTIGDPNGAPSAGSGGTSGGTTGSSAGGWQGTIDEYWDWYGKNNAFQEYLKLVGGTCLKSEAQLNDARSKMDRQCSDS